MKKLLFTCLFIGLYGLLLAKDEGNTIKIKIEGLKDCKLFLGNHFGDKQYVTDTTDVDSKGLAIFKTKKNLDGGIYLVIIPSKKYFEILVDGKENDFYIETDTVDFVGHMKIKGSPENQLFNDYQNFLTKKAKDSEPLKRGYERFKNGNKDSLKFYQDKLTAIDKEVKDYKINLIGNKSTTFLSKIVKSTAPPEVPDAPILPNGRKDSTFAYRYYKAHFWDNIDFSDPRILRTPIFQAKVKEYLDQLTYQIPDSINASADVIIEKSKANKEMFKFCVVHITSTYERSNIMGMDGVFVHLGKKYYTYNQAYWVDSTTVFKIQDRAKRTEPLLIGKKAPWFACKDTNNQWVDMHKVKSKYLVLIFWDPDCGHCKKAMPFLIEAYPKLKKAGVEFLGSCTELERDKWVKYIRENKLPWINVGDWVPESNFRYDYFIESTPQLFVLDENKKIIAKKIGAEQLYDFFAKSLKIVPEENKPSDTSEKDKLKSDVH